MKSRRTGFTLVELVVALVIGALLVSASLRASRSAQRAASSVVERASDAARYREILGVLRGELWTVDPAAGDVLSLGPDSVTYRAVRSLLVSCGPPVRAMSGWEVVVSETVRGTRASRPENGRLMVLWPDSVGEAWYDVQLSGARDGVPCPEGAPGIALELASLPAGPAPTSLLLRAYEVVTIRAYQASDGRWWVGARERAVSGASQIQPFAGPVSEDGLRFSVDDSGYITVAIPNSRFGPAAVSLAPGAGRD